MDSVVAAHLLEQVDAVGEQTRALVRSLWYPFGIWGVLTGGGAIAAAVAPDQQGWYWLSACVVGMYGTTRYYHQRSLRLGAMRNGCRPLAAGTVMCVTILAVSIAIPSVATPWVAAGLGYQLMARVVRSWTVSAAGWLLIAAAVAGQIAIAGDGAAVAVDMACSVVLFATAFILRSQERAPA